MRQRERGTPRPLYAGPGEVSIKVSKDTTYLKGTKGVFMTSDIWPTIITATKPLLDRSNTPRQALREITSERNFSNKRWLYAKNICEDFNPNISKKEVKRSKHLRKIQKKEDKEKLSGSARKSKTSYSPNKTSF